MIGVVAEFLTPEAMLEGIRAARSRGIAPAAIEAYAPFDVEGTSEALGLPRSPVPALTLLGGVFGVAFALTIQWLVTAVDYPLIAGGRPVNPLPAYVPVTVEIGILGAAFGAFLAVLGLCDLPSPWHPLFEVEGFERAAGDRFFVRVLDGDAAVAQALREAGAVAIRRMEPR